MRRGLRSLFVPSGALVLAAVAIAGPLEAQLARPRVASPDSPKLLVVPIQRDNVDSVLSLLIADGMRDRLRNNHLDKFNTISRQNLNENLTASGFPIDVPLEAQTVRQLARFLNARLIVEGSMIRQAGDSVFIITRLSEAIGNQPQAVTASIKVALARAGTGTGGELVNRLVEGYRSFDDVQQCRTALEANNLQRAEQKARDGLRDYPHNASAYLCVASIREAQRASNEIVMAVLDSAYQADTLNVNTMRRIAAKYEAANDTANLLVYLQRILTIDFRDNELRTRTVRLLVTRGEVDRAIALIDRGLEQNPASVELLTLKGLAQGAKAAQLAQRGADTSLAAGSRDSVRRLASTLYDSAATAFEIVAGVDSARVDSLFVLRITSYLRAVPDTARWLNWLRVGTARMPSNLDYWFGMGNIRLVRGDTAGAVEAARGLLANVGTSDDATARGYRARALYLLANTYAGRGEFDSAIVFADQSVGADSTLRPSVAGVYIRAGLQPFRDSMWTVAIERFQRGRDYGTGRTLQTASFYLGYAQVRYGAQQDARVEAERNCDVARSLPELWDRAEQNVVVGAPINREGANQLLQAIQGYKQRAGQLLQNHCR